MQVLERNGFSFDDVAYIVPHQANKRIIDFASAKLKVPKEKFYVNIDRFGNTSSASIPIALDEMNRRGMLKKGDLLSFLSPLIVRGAAYGLGNINDVEPAFYIKNCVNISIAFA